jgi:hypothetical protein
MISIVKGSTKTWYLTLSEKVTIANPRFLFSLIHSQTESITNIILTDVSTFPERYNKFVVTEGSTFNLYSGQYKYIVYAQTSSSNTDPELANEEVESGILLVDAPSQPEVFYNPL